jgi:hypothetical protein
VAGKAGDVTRYVAPIRRHDTARGHHYKDSAGTRVPGVTTIIGDGVPKPALINWAANATAEAAIDRWAELTALGPAKRLKELQGARYAEKDAAARRGTEVHRAAEELLAGRPVKVPEEIAGHVEQYARFLDEFKVKPIYVEFSCVSYRWGYAGTADLCAGLVLPDKGPKTLLMDLKTTRSGVFGETALQLAAYRYPDVWVINDEEVPPVEVDYCAAIHVRGDGYELVPVEAGEQEFKDFLYAMRISQFAARARELVGPAIMAPTTSTFRLTREDR